MRRWIATMVALGGLLVPQLASAHPHIWIQQVVRVVAKDGKYTHVEIEWRFDPFSSEIEIPAIDEDQDGRISPQETRLLARDTLAELGKFGFMTWLSTGGAEFRPKGAPVFTARIDDPATFMPPDWDRAAGDGGMPMPQNKRAGDTAGPRKRGPRNLVYVMRFALPQPAPTVSITTFDSDDFVRIEVDRSALPRGCSVTKSPTHRSEFVRGFPVLADTVSCRLS